METDLWNAYVRLSNRQDREFVFRGSQSDVDHLREWFVNNQHVMEYDIGREYADFDANDVIEEVASWIDGEY